MAAAPLVPGDLLSYRPRVGRGLRLVAAGVVALVCVAPAAAHTDGGWGLYLQWPASGTITRGFGPDGSEWHPGIDIGTLIGNMVITETVFNLRGLGHLTIQAINQQDLPVIMGVTIVAAIFLVAANVIVDLLYAVVDPRVSYA